MITRIKEIKPKKAILVHIEESELQGMEPLEKIKKENREVIFGSDGMEIC